jgi:hypothetical protein
MDHDCDPLLALLPANPRSNAMPLADIHPVKGGTSAGRKKTVTGKTPAATDGKSLRDLTWLTVADVKFLAFG